MTNVDEEVLLDRLAKRIVDLRLDTVVIFWLTVLSSMGRIWSQLARLYLQPIIILLGNYGESFLDVIQDRDKIDKLINKIEELGQQG